MIERTSFLGLVNMQLQEEFSQPERIINVMIGDDISMYNIKQLTAFTLKSGKNITHNTTNLTITINIFSII